MGSWCSTACGRWQQGLVWGLWDLAVVEFADVRRVLVGVSFSQDISRGAAQRGGDGGNNEGLDELHSWSW